MSDPTGPIPAPTRPADGVPAPAAAPTPARRDFARSTAGVFATRIVLFGMSIASSFLIARLLGEAGTGLYSRAMLYGTMAYVLAQLGLPSAATFFSGRGYSIRDLRRGIALLLVVISVLVVAVALVSMPLVQAGPMQGVWTSLLVAAILSIPFQFATSVVGQVLYGRHVFRGYNIVQLFQYGSMIVFVVVLVGILGQGVLGAIVAFTASYAVSLVGVVWLVSRVRDTREQAAKRLPTRSFLSYGLRVYPSSVPSFFSYRADVLLLGWMAVADAQIGLYAIAVRFAEMLFYVPDSIATVLYPTISGATRADADRRIVQVTRITLLATVLLGLALIPSAYVALRLLLPKFVDSMPALIVILPGIVSLSLSKVLAAYIQGVGRPGPVSVAAIVGLVINLVANILLIPRLGIVGAAASSAISYSCHAAMMLAIASRISGTPVHRFVTPGKAEVMAMLGIGRRILTALRRRLGGSPPVGQPSRPE